ncbi:MAG: MopE-related protein, partial [Myxococcota bacterium]
MTRCAKTEGLILVALIVAFPAGCPSEPCGPLQRFVDADGDGSGAGPLVTTCTAGQTYAADDDDCDDDDPTVHPGGDEVCDAIDNDCNGIIDEGWVIRTWYEDTDGDGFGAPGEGVEACASPGEGWAPFGTDCDDADGSISPIVDEICGDGIDQDCDGMDASCARGPSCQSLLEAAPDAETGIYTLELDESPVEVFCDMQTDGGGWTLVASTALDPLLDTARFYYPDLQTLSPTSWNIGIWRGLRDVIDPVHDLRFACKADRTNDAMTVDLSFYDVPWYHTITTGLDTTSCFSTSAGRGEPDPPPSRTNN